MRARRTSTVTGGILTALVVAGCSGSPGAGSSAGSSAPTRSAASASRSSSSATGTPGKPASAAVVRAVGAAFQAFFSSRSTVAQSQASLQNGARFHAILVQQGKSQYASRSSARVLSVQLLSPNVASVSYDILGDGQPLLQDVHGHAVRQNGRWVVAAETFCGLLRLQQQAPPACSDPSVTALPS